jgi:hypothetical protein
VREKAEGRRRGEKKETETGANEHCSMPKNWKTEGPI